MTGLVTLLGACTPSFRDPAALRAPEGHLDLRAWNFAVEGPVQLQDWAWDPNVLWGPNEGRPSGLPTPTMAGGPERGGILGSLLGPGVVAVATARLTILVDDHRNYGFLIGTFPGALRVWVNGALVRESGVVSADPAVYRPGASGEVLSIQPRDGVLDLVVELATNDPLVRHFELDRAWVVGPAQTLLANDRSERAFRTLQAVILALGALVFLWISTLRPARKSLVFFVFFLLSCLAKLLVNVEQPDPLLNSWIPGLPWGVALFLNHGLNLVPFPLMVLFLLRQYPEDLKLRSFVVVSVVTVVLEVWELLPFVFLALGWQAGYLAVYGTLWSTILNIFVVGIVLFLFERFYLVFTRKRPLARSLFLGGILIGLTVLVPVPLSYFVPVKFTYFLGWGIFLFLGILMFDLIRVQVKATQDEVTDLHDRLGKSQTLSRFISPGWAPRLGRETVDALRPGDHRSIDAVLVQVRSIDGPVPWFEAAGTVAVARGAVLVDWREGTATWALDVWSEAGLAFALDLQRRLTALSGLRFRIVATRAVVEFRILNAGTQWIPLVLGLPFDRLEAIAARAEESSVVLAIDACLQDGLVVGGWRRHRRFTTAGTEIELYEAQDEATARLKDQSLDAFESALVAARAGQYPEAVSLMLGVARQNPFDPGARALLTAWEGIRRP